MIEMFTSQSIIALYELVIVSFQNNFGFQVSFGIKYGDT